MDESVIDAIVATRRVIAEFEAVEAGLYAAALDAALRSAAPGASADMPVRALAAEIGAAVRMGDPSVQRRLDEAYVLTTRFPATFAAFAEGRMTRAHATAIVDAGARLDDEARVAYEAAAIGIAERESVGRLRSAVRRLAERMQPRPLDERHRDAAEERAVRVSDLDDGMSELRAILPSVFAHGMLDRLTELGLAVKRARAAAPDGADGVLDGFDADADGRAAAPDTRTLDQLRADLLADLVLTGAPSTCDGTGGLGGIRAEVLVTVPLLTLAGQADVDGSVPAPAMLDGVTPIDADTARRLAGGAPGWDRVLTHPVTGAVLAVDRYRPSADLRRFLRATDQRCRFPCCRRPARRCDLDHLEEAARGGPTECDNLASECRRHHVVRHAAGWRVARRKDGVVVWTSPLGRVYPDHPPGVVFRARPDPLATGGRRDAPF